jgi:uncharacterized membrane protein YpjA
MWIFLFFSKKIASSTMLEFWIKTPINKKNPSLLILTNIKLKFEECILNLIWKWCTKDPKKTCHLIFMNFGVKNVIVKTTQKRKLWCLNAIISWIPWNDRVYFLRLMSNKAIQRSYICFLKFSYFAFWRKLFLQLCQIL